MVMHIDFSSPELHPAAILDFIKAHREDRPPANILFKVTQEVFELYGRNLPKDVVTVSQEEADEMNTFLGLSWGVHDYLMGARFPCSECKRVLTFYDVFQSGRKRHGDEYIKRILGGGEYHLQVARKGQTIEIDCTACGNSNWLGYDAGGHTGYHTSSYTYA